MPDDQERLDDFCDRFDIEPCVFKYVDDPACGYGMYESVRVQGYEGTGWLPFGPIYRLTDPDEYACVLMWRKAKE